MKDWLRRYPMAPMFFAEGFCFCAVVGDAITLSLVPGVIAGSALVFNTWLIWRYTRQDRDGSSRRKPEGP